MAVDPDLYPCIEGSTDSEVMFYLGADLRRSRTTRSAPWSGWPGSSRRPGIGTAREHPLQMTVGLSDGEQVIAVRYASGPEVNTLFVSTSVHDIRLLLPAEERFRHFSDEARVVVSEPLIDLPGAVARGPAVDRAGRARRSGQRRPAVRAVPAVTAQRPAPASTQRPPAASICGQGGADLVGEVGDEQQHDVRAGRDQRVRRDDRDVGAGHPAAVLVRRGVRDGGEQARVETGDPQEGHGARRRAVAVHPTAGSPLGGAGRTQPLGRPARRSPAAPTPRPGRARRWPPRRRRRRRGRRSGGRRGWRPAGRCRRRAGTGARWWRSARPRRASRPSPASSSTRSDRAAGRSTAGRRRSRRGSGTAAAGCRRARAGRRARRSAARWSGKCMSPKQASTTTSAARVGRRLR